jgi:3-oxoacyl-[acyl-carrier-protein] synthase-3
MDTIRATITGVAAAVPDYILTNEELSQMVDTTDEWIMTRIGIKERHIIREPGKGSSDVGAKAVSLLLEKTNTKPEEIDLLICATVTPDMQFPATANIISEELKGKIVDVIKKGYMLNDKVIRYSQVVIGE